MRASKGNRGGTRAAVIVLVAALAIGGLSVLPGHARGASSHTSQSFEKLTYQGTTSFGAPPVKSQVTLKQVIDSNDINRLNPGTGGNFGRQPADHVPHVAGSPTTTTNPGFFGFNGLSGLQSMSNPANGFDVEPPDQALCSNGHFVVEGVNIILAVFNTDGTLSSGPTSLYTFFHDNATDFPIGDIKCFWDPPTGHWFITQLDFLTNGTTGAFQGGATRVQIAVSTGTTPTTFNLFDLNTTTDPATTNCPCFGDQPLIGADANGFYISTNEFSNGFVTGAFTFNGAQLYAMSKTDLAAGIAPTVVHIDTAGDLLSLGGTQSSIQPATVPPGGAFASNTEFLQSIAFGGTISSSAIVVWALTGTNTLTNPTPSLTLLFTVVPSELFVDTIHAAEQKPGPTPLAENSTALAQLGVTTEPKLSFVNPDDFRMEQVVFADGMLWAGVNTAALPPNGPVRDEIAFFLVAPSISGGTLAGSVVSQGYVAVNQENVMYPSIGVNPSGKAVMVFTLVGPDLFPSVAYVTVSPTLGTSVVHIAGAGVAPDDGFTGYLPGFQRTSRWGDYSAAVAAPDGSIWIAAEFIPGPRDTFVNWGTFIGNVVVP